MPGTHSRWPDDLYSSSGKICAAGGPLRVKAGSALRPGTAVELAGLLHSVPTLARQDRRQFRERYLNTTSRRVLSCVGCRNAETSRIDGASFLVQSLP